VTPDEQRQTPRDRWGRFATAALAAAIIVLVIAHWLFRHGYR
jgi:hypothetical protein